MKQKQFIAKVMIGFVAGIISGLFASGGGMILVPAFLYLLKMKDSEARATSVFCMLPIVIASGIVYHSHQWIQWKTGILCAIGGILGGIIGAKLLKKLPETYIRILFVLFLSYASFKIIMG